LLVNEVMRLMLNQQLFTFVTTPAAVQPNGHSERSRPFCAQVKAA
jgi:hypothetical protein